MALKLLLTFAGEKGIRSLQIVGNSMVVINWVNKTQRCHNIRLLPILEEVFIILVSYENYSMWHVYSERNMATDPLSKAGLQLDIGQWHLEEIKEGTHFEFFHRPFIDLMGQDD